jgi:hypothetical protein
MKIIYDVKWSVGDLLRMDAIVIDKNEFADRSALGWTYAFRGDDRDPGDIFATGFKKRTASYQLTAAAIATPPLSWATVLGRPEKPVAAAMRNQGYALAATEVLFRTNHFDLLKETCISLTRDFNLCVGFPLKADGADEEGVTFNYIVKLPDKVLPTYEVQKGSSNLTLHQSLEVTCNEIPADLVIGAAKVKRTVKGTASMSTVTYKIERWYQNVRRRSQVGPQVRPYLQNLVETEIGKPVVVEGTKNVVGGIKGMEAKVDSNLILGDAVEWLAKKIHPTGGITGQRVRPTVGPRKRVCSFSGKKPASLTDD